MIDLGKLELLKEHGGKYTARCPVCAVGGGDERGMHLRIDKEGRFCCVVHSGPAGRLHRKEIFRLVGIKKERAPARIVWRLRK